MNSKFKRVFIITSFFTLYAFSIVRSQGLYIGIGGGYGLPTASGPKATDRIVFLSSDLSGTTNNTTTKNIAGSGSYGKGTQFNLQIGSVLKNNLCAFTASSKSSSFESIAALAW